MAYCLYLNLVKNLITKKFCYMVIVLDLCWVCVVLELIIGILVGKPDDDKLVWLLVIILGIILNTELGNCESFSLY